MKKLLCLIILVGGTLKLRGQDVNSMAFPSANNAFLGMAGNASASSEVGVNLYTGAALVNIPICNLSSKELNIFASLSYTGGKGIKVQDYATPVGLGWQLNAGGGISRVVRGFPDERSNGYLGTGLWGQKVADAANNGTPLPSQLTGGTNPITPPTADGEPDIYYVKTPFFSFQFTFDEFGKAVFSNNTGLKIIPQKFYNSPLYYNSSFEVIDDNGNQYYFGGSPQSKESTTANLLGVSYTFPTTWYLDKIVTYNSKDSAIFSYTSFVTSDILYHYRSSTTYDIFGNKNVDSAPVQYTVNSPKFISTIVSSLGEMDFVYAMDRRDDANAPRLSQVVLKAYDPNTQLNNKMIRTFDFNYSYFGDPATDPDLLRLRLDNITVSGNTSETATPVTFRSFLYNLNVNLPSRKLLSSIDYWGYYSFTASTNPDNVSIAPNQEYAMANILTDIKDIAGGDCHIDYELNSYYDATSSNNVEIGGLRVNKISKILPSGEDIHVQYIYEDGNGNSTGQILSNSYMINIWSSCGLYKTFSESPSDYYDLNGNFVGYSSVNVLNQNGGYAIFQFSNFSDPGCNDIFNYSNSSSGSIPDITSSISFAYKRGLLLNKTIYNAANGKISEDINTYASLTNPILKKSWAYHWKEIAASVAGQSCVFSGTSTYWTNIENYRLSQSVHKDYDQTTPSKYIQTTVDYTYADNNRLIRSTSTTNSEGSSHAQTFYHADDINIPMVTEQEQEALDEMVGSNRCNVLVHTIDNLNGVIHQEHNSYNVIQVGYAPNVYLTSSDSYTGSTLEDRHIFNYDASTSQLTSSTGTGGQITSVQYGYHSSLPVVQAINATHAVSYTNQVISQRNTLYIPPNNWGAQYASFTTAAAGTITVAMPTGSYLAGGVSCFFSFYLSGPATRSGDLCNSSSTSYTCSVSNSVIFTNMPAGTYSLSVTPYTNTAASSVPVDYTYPTFQVNKTEYSEFFFEGFEENTSGLSGNAHTGNVFYDSNISGQPYTVPFTLPNSRSYLLQWWSFTSNAWALHEQPYTGPVSLSGRIDDVRIFPSDARMTTYTYDPLVGQTSQTDPAGITTSYQYDGLGRPELVLDNDNNIIKEMDYKYQVKTQYKVYLRNISGTTSSSIYVLFDGVRYEFPANGADPLLITSVRPGTNHTISFSCGPEFNYRITPGINFYCADTQPAISWTVNSDITLTCYEPSFSVVGNLTSDATSTTACSCTGCQYTRTVYVTGSASVGTGTQLYYDADLTQKVTGKTWFRPYTGAYVVWPLNSTGMVSGSSQPCQ